MANVIMSLGLILGSVLCIWSVAALGRKTSIVGGIIFQAAGLIGLVVMDLAKWYELLYPTCVLYMVGYGALAGVGMLWMVETIPSVGIGMALGVEWFCGGLVGLFVPMMTDKWPGPTGTLIFFTFWAVIGIFVLDYAIIETKGKQMDEVEQEYLHFKYRPFRLCPRNVVG
jgi:hypothetical protein